MRILLVEDDSNLNSLLCGRLADGGYAVDACQNGQDALFWLSQAVYDMILLDRRLPDMEGIRLLEKIRASGLQTPVIFMTALGELQDKIDGFSAGADDYISKPFHAEELMARMKAILRRPREMRPEADIRWLDLTLDPSRHTLGCAGRCVDLTRTEYQMAELFMKNPARVFSRETLLASVWGAGSDVEPNNVDNYVYFLRRHLKEIRSRAKIQTVYGIGYLLTED